MKIEHVAFQVEEPAKSCDWYCHHLKFNLKLAKNEPVCVRFLADEQHESMLEFYNNPKVTTPDYSAMDPLLLHIAFVCIDVPETVQRLVAAGATLVSGPETIATGDELAMLRDPWGMAIQLCKRANPMIL